MNVPRRSAGREHAWAQNWLFQSAFPLWLERGWDRSTGGFSDVLTFDGAMPSAPDRLRVQTRQMYVYASAGKLGWKGDWQDAVSRCAHFLRRYERDDHLYISSLAKVSPSFDLYDQAFVLLALASAYERLGCNGEFAKSAKRIVASLRGKYASRHLGFEESVPPTQPLRSNPHMHLLEAALAWIALGIDDPFRALALEILELAKSKLLVGNSIAELFDRDWRPLESETDSLREPGHQFEWAFLLSEADRILGTSSGDLQQCLYEIGTRGVDRSRNVVAYSINSQGHVVDGRARLWAQTEKLRAALRFTWNVSESCDIEESFACVKSFFDVPVPGLWYEWQAADGSFEISDVPATSLYHIVGGLTELFRLNDVDTR